MSGNSGVKSQHDKNLLLFGASERGNIAQAQTALDEGADINAKWNHYHNITALIIASANHHLDMVKFLFVIGQ
ncbi:ankyrin repeat domain-containing protein [Desulfosarcina variabilis]|uniref:ankyrin repeat domain-containing protein n=1 Tax=Desulfosarcina variabilis TaxID=2300 RepID=UPI003AFA0C34